jgi:DNA-binding protein H-NS
MAKNGIDLSKLSIEEMQALTRDIETEIVARRAADKERVLTQMRELAGSLGMTLEELLREERGGGGGGGGVAPKYRNPENPALTWSGRGKRPLWINEALAAGKTLEDLAVS